jgi:hypothetical protein
MAFSDNSKKSDALAPKGIRRYHRQISLVSLFTLTFFSGAYHATTNGIRTRYHKWYTNLTLKPSTYDFAY